MAEEVTLEKKPWWVSKEELDGLKSTPQANMAESVVAGVPELHSLTEGPLEMQYTQKDGLLVYHFYKTDRKKIYDDAHKRMDVLAEKAHSNVRDREIARAAQEANEALDAVPWWPEIEAYLNGVFTVIFRDMERKVSYYREADSWSVILPEPITPLGLTQEKLESPFLALIRMVELKLQIEAQIKHPLLLKTVGK
jgi:hypothetical protein